MAKKANDKQSSRGKRDAESVVKDLEKSAAKALSKAEELLNAAKRAADDASTSAQKAKKSAKKAKKAVKAGGRPGWDGVPTSPSDASISSGGPAQAASGQGASGSKTPSVSEDGASVTGAPPLPTPDSADAPSIAWSVSKLRGAAREHGVRGYWSMRKNQLVDALTTRK